MTQERKNKLLVVSLVSLSVLTVLTFFLLNNDNQIEIDKNIFRVDDLKKIERISLARKSDTVDIAYGSSGWLINQKYKADNRMIQVLFATLQQAEPKRMMSESVKDSISQLLQEEGTQVTLFEEGQVKKQFRAGGNQNKTIAYFQNPDDGNIYVMAIPGYKVYVSGILELDAPGYRDKYVFGFRWENFKGLEVTVPEKGAADFIVSMSNNYFSIEGMPQTDTTKLYNYLDEVARLTVDGFKPLNFDTTLTRNLYNITVYDIASRSYTLKLYSSDNPREINGVLNGEGVYFEERKIRPLMREKSFFINKTR